MHKNKNWIETTISHREPEKVPYNFMFSPVALSIMEKHYGSPIEEILGFPIRMTGPKSIKPLYADPAQFGDTIKDEFGVVWSTNKIDRGVPIDPCLNEPVLSNYKFPDPSAAYRFANLTDWCNKNQEHYRIIWVGDLWERATFMRGTENILLDLSLSSKFVENLLRGITDYILETMGILFDRFEFDGIALSDDYGIQKSMLMSPAQWRKFIKPLLIEIYALTKKRGRTVFHHSCGNIYSIIGDLIDIGLDILHPVQPEAMDVFKLKREFGHGLTLCGGIRTQDLLPRGTPENIRSEIRKLKEELGRGGGYILEPGITIQADVPLDNLVAMINAARN